MKAWHSLLFAMYCCSAAQPFAQGQNQSLSAAKTNEVSTELLNYNLKTTVEAYDKVGRKNPKWDAKARTCLSLFANIRSTTNQNVSELLEQIKTNLAAVAALDCDDPLVRYLHTRYVAASTEPASRLRAVYDDIVSELARAGYPAIRKFYGRLWVYRVASEARTEPDRFSLLEEAAPFLAEVLQDKSMPAAEATSACEELMSEAYWPNAVRWRIYKILEPALTNNWKDSSFALLAKGRAYLTYGWMARGGGYANSVSENGWKLLQDRLQISADSLEAAWAANPKDPSICLEMMRVELGQGKGINRLETWFKRGMKLNPSSYNIWVAKLEYLRPRWYGSVPEMIQFGWQSMTNSDWADSVRLGLANAHYEASREMSDSGKMNAYLQRADVWSDIRTNFEYFFRLYPEEAGYRHNYAWFAERAGDSAEFLRQVKLFSSTNFGYFGGVDRFNKMLEHAKENAGEKKEGAPASAKGK